ncbi:hypothetical protein [Oceanicoccus sp. KOV_DT_Chl]|uniref:hypothetical protein n=1 Tax=Oceanicoccus sp. KOV_DT_Chl TaxID=1904639 RepID=UPI000C798A4E|nr:hypothetical protein [Oceanicoccus sp. KOV_DT_Chl]
MVDSVLSAGLQGVQSGLNSARQAAQDIARATTSEAADPVNPPAPLPASDSGAQSNDALASITESVVQLKVSELQVQASTAVVRTADEVLGTLINTKA